MLPTIAVTAGEPAGVGPELCAALKHAALPARIVVIADRALLRERTQLEWPEFSGGCATTSAGPSELSVLHVPLTVASIAGKLQAENSRYVLRTVGIAADGCIDRRFDAMATAPVHKGVLNDAGIAFTGHTEFLAERTHAPHVVMMLVGGGLRVALATTHLALSDVPRAITRGDITGLQRIHKNANCTNDAVVRNDLQSIFFVNGQLFDI